MVAAAADRPEGIQLMSELFHTTGKRVRILRQDMGMTQDEMHRRLADAGARVSRSYVSVIERQDILAGSDLVRGLAKVLNTSADYLLMLTDDPSPSRSNLEGETEPLDAAVRNMAERINHTPAPLRQQLLEVVDLILRMTNAPE